MIYVAVSVQRSFRFPADLPTTCAYFRDFARVLGFLTPLRLVKTYAPDQYRILYSVTESGLYQLAFYCDLQVHYDQRQRTLYVTPLAGIAPVQAKVRLNSLTGQGYYSSQSIFHASGNQTRVDYDVDITATVPKRLEWSLIPDRIIEHVATNRTRQRLNDMTDQFIARSIEEFRQQAPG